MSNRLQKERSPYLLQHAENPVDWRPWSPHVFEEAARRDLPVFLSIGYSTCHWCHVMARESFSDQAVAQVINASFLPVKVDREERPDVDGVYMAACIAMNGSGGWPLTLLLTPDQKPFWAGTYLPKDQLVRLLLRADQLWREDRQALLSAGETLTAYLRQSREARGEPPTRALLQEAEELLEQAFDSQWGGFGSPPKFPSPHTLLFLLRYGRLAHRPRAGEMALGTLDAMYRGGLFDHVGGGFSRYSTDRRWLIPHFEKMLYDNALLSLAYTEGYQHTGRPLYAEVARRTLDYVLEELADPQGGFYCGQDADSRGREGGYYLFTPQELAQTLGQTGGRRFCRWYGITQAGNFEGQSLPNLLDQPEFDREPPEMAALRQQVSAYRRSRVPLHRDDKVLTAWNGLMLASLARAGAALGEPRYTAAARRAADFLHRRLTTAGGRLLARWREGDAAYPGTLEDYAFCTWGLLELYSATLDPAYLARALALAELLLDFFFDPDQGGFFPYASDAEQLLTRTKDAYDGAMPSGNSAAALVLCRLSRLTGEERWRKAAQLQLSWLAGAARQYPAGHCFGLLAFLEELWPSAQLVAAGQSLPEDLFSLLERSPRIGLTLLGRTPETAPVLDTLLPFTKEYPIPERGTCYYLCRNNTCSPPVKTVEELALLLDRDPS